MCKSIVLDLSIQNNIPYKINKKNFKIRFKIILYEKKNCWQVKLWFFFHKFILNKRYLKIFNFLTIQLKHNGIFFLTRLQT